MDRITLRRRVPGLGGPGRLRALLVLGALVASPAALAQGSTSVLTGNVVDASTRAPVADVVVTATSPSLQGEQVVVTDSSGLYRVPQLPPGTYTLRFEKETYRPYSRTAIEVARGPHAAPQRRAAPRDRRNRDGDGRRRTAGGRRRLEHRRARR